MQAIVLGTVLGVVAWLRLDPTSRGTLWAEDGREFLADRERLGPWRSLLHVYDGYLHVVPRLWTDLAVLVPVEDHAVAVTALCCATVGAVGALVFACTRDVVGSAVVRVGLASTTVLVPAAPVEVLGNLANLHWYGLWLAPWLVLARPARWRGALGLGVVGLLAALTEIQVVLVLPLVLWRLRDRRTWPVAVGLAAGVVAQLVATAAHPRRRGDVDAATVMDVVKGYLANVVVPLWRPSADGPGSLLADHGWRGAAALAVPFVLAGLVSVAVVVRRARRSDPSTGISLVVLTVLSVGAVVPFVAGLVVNFGPSYAYDTFTAGQVAGYPPIRYGVIAGISLIAIVLWSLDGWAGSASRRRVVAARLAVAVVVAAMVAHVRLDSTLRSDGPTWRTGVEAAREQCRAGMPRPFVPAAPNGYWAVQLTCDELGISR